VSHFAHARPLHSKAMNRAHMNDQVPGGHLAMGEIEWESDQDGGGGGGGGGFFGLTKKNQHLAHARPLHSDARKDKPDWRGCDLGVVDMSVDNQSVSALLVRDKCSIGWPCCDG
jgi:hypothetical protein